MKTINQKTDVIFVNIKTFCILGCHGWKDRCLLRKAGASPGKENITPFPPNYYNFEIKKTPFVSPKYPAAIVSQQQKIGENSLGERNQRRTPKPQHGDMNKCAKFSYKSYQMYNSLFADHL